MIEKNPLISTMLMSMLMLIFLAFGGELAAREYGEQVPLNPHRGTSHAMFEIKYNHLRAFDEKVGGVDCIFIGSSMTYRGIDPDTFEQTYLMQTGEEIECFNFGLNGISATEEMQVATILVEEFKPSLIIWGVSPRDFSIGVGQTAADSLIDTPWVSYRLGQFSVSGWLSDSSALFQVYTAIQANNDSLSRVQFRRRNKSITSDGYVKNPQIIGDGVSSFTKKTLGSDDYSLLNFVFGSGDLEAIKIFAEFQAEGIEVIIVEIPVPPNYYDLFDGGEEGYEAVMDRVNEEAEEHELIFLRIMQLNLISDEGWQDHDHLNHTGAVAFSEWLGLQFGDEVIK